MAYKKVDREAAQRTITEKIPTEKALNTQVGGGHYKELGIQPLENTYATYGYIGLKAAVHTKVDKYLKRKKNSEVEDIKKAIHTLEILLDAAIEEFGDG